MKRIERRTQEKVKGLLIKELSQRKSRNSQLSLRSFARVLKISPAHLSNILSGRRPITGSNLQNIFQALDLSHAEKKEILQAPLPTENISKKVLSDEELSEVSQWHYFAILNLSQIPKARADSRWIARRLGISEVDALEALRRLEMNGMIIIENGFFVQAGQSVDTKNDVPSKNVRRILRQGLERAIESLDSVPVAEREFGAQYLAIDAQNIDEYKQLLRSFKSQVDALANAGASKSEVYCFSYQFFPVSRKSKSEESKS